MCETDLYPTEYDLKPITLEPEPPSITELEQRALRGVRLIEHAAEPINKWSIMRGMVKLSAHIARRVRDASR